MRGLGSGPSNGQVEFEVYYHDQLTSIMLVDVHLLSVEAVAIFGNSEAVLHAEFRLIPDIMVAGARLQGSECDFDYQWSTSNAGVVQLSELAEDLKISGAGVNATGRSVGESEIRLSLK